MNYYLFDFNGVCLGWIDSNGAFFDRHGTNWAALRGADQVYDLTGRYRGRVDPQGSLFGEDGRCRGYVRGWDRGRFSPTARPTAARTVHSVLEGSWKSRCG